MSAALNTLNRMREALNACTKGQVSQSALIEQWRHSAASLPLPEKFGLVLGDLLDRAEDTMLHIRLDRVSPMAVPLMVMIGRESVAQGSVDDALLVEAESLAGIAMTP